MTPGARLQALCDLLADLEKGGAADAAASRFFRERRFIGSKDRTEIAERFYTHLRRRARLEWWVNRALERPADAPPPAVRHRVIAELILCDRWSETRFNEHFDGGSYRPAGFSRAERQLLELLTGQTLEHPDQPDWVRREAPDWMAERLVALLGAEEAEQAFVALNRSAPLDLRVNALKSNRDAAQAALAAAGVRTEPTELSPLGLRAKGRPSLGALQAFQDGLVEVQDEGSQLVALIVGAKPGMAVLDYCAGAGGKTLALAACMANKGVVVAADNSAHRLERSAQRLRRAGAHNVERRAIAADNKGWFKRQRGRFDRVLVDAPCGGSGTWRRNPDMKWRITLDDVRELHQRQGEILDRAADLTKPGGRLIYATCSLLPDENEATIDAFLARRADYRRLNVRDLWAETIGGPCPVDGPDLRLFPHRHEVDGFYAAVLERVDGPKLNAKTATDKADTSDAASDQTSDASDANADLA